ncbi:carbohydrate ABC transporter permease [Mucisphaera sp.]|uniref:carbohydrate ABC transporter permease n=1 Tax=Mucisphaera sp. TaxID=2913024 RepID=UPI003D1470F7
MPKKLSQLVRFIILCIGGFIFTVPMLWMISTSLKPIDQTMSLPPQWLPMEARVDLFGRSVQVGDGSVDEDAANDDVVTVAFAYQWQIEIDNQAVPVRALDDPMTEEVNAEIRVIANYHWEADIEDERVDVRLRDMDTEAPEAGAVDVLVPLDDGSFSIHTITTDRLHRVYDLTDDEVDAAISLEQRLVVPAVAVSRSVIDWDEREYLAHALTEDVQVRAGDIERNVNFRWRNYGEAIAEMAYFPQYLINSLTLCFLTVFGTVLSCSIVAYGFSRIDWPGRDKVFFIVLATMMIPFPVTMVPLYGLFREFGWIGTLQPLWVPTFFGAAFNIFLLRQFFKTIPRELSEAATIDGCGHIRIFLQVILPLAKPAIAVVALFQFLATWNDFLGPLIYLTEQQDFTLALGLQFFQSRQGGTQWHYLMAASTMVVLPVILLFFLAQRTFIEGISMTGMKG